MTGRITMSDVAREAGVSLMTVSRVVNDKDDVSQATRQRVLQVIDRLGYRPSGIARGLATKRTGTLGLVVPDVANPFFSELARGAESIAYAAGYNVFLCNTEEDPARELRVLQSLEEKRIDGLVLCSSRLERDALRRAVSHFAAVVLVNRPLDEPGVSKVFVDDVAGGLAVTRHLLAAGHRRIGFLAGPAASFSGRRRLQGYRAALSEAGLTYRAEWLRHGAPSAEGGHRAARQLLADSSDLTALFCYNDLVAVGALQACAELDRRVPDDLAIVGFDDIPFAALVTPPLTTCRVPRHELGARAVRLLLDRFRGEADGDREVVLRPELVVRASAP
ncbi:MAG: LacI family DNA-binding transcriptional regulator [Anaerolineae bacterium]|jgi:LacI family transcriptional regulator